MLNVMLVDDSALLRDRIKQFLADIPKVQIVGEYETGLLALEAIRQKKPDVVVLDIHMPDGSGVVTLKEIKHLYPRLTTIMFTNYSYPTYRNICKRLGADHFFDKSTEYEGLVELLTRLAKKKAS